MKKLIALLVTIGLVMSTATTSTEEEVAESTVTISTAKKVDETMQKTSIAVEVDESTGATATEEEMGASTITITSEKEEEEKKPIFEEDLSICKEGPYLSVYNRSIRENVKGEWAECDCYYLCFCTQLYHIQEYNKEEDFYSAFFNGENINWPIGKIYLDNSYSMKQTFCYETLNIIKNLTPFITEKEIKFEGAFEYRKTDLYGFLNSLDKGNFDGYNVISLDQTPIIITDLWDTEENEEEKLIYDGRIVFCVPYASSNNEGVLHCEEVANNLIWNYGWIFGTSVYIVYTDNVIVEYSNCFCNGEEGYITIYVPYSTIKINGVC